MAIIANEALMDNIGMEAWSNWELEAYSNRDLGMSSIAIEALRAMVASEALRDSLGMGAWRKIL